MESEKAFVPKPEKPPVLFHASSNRSIDRFEPRDEKTRDESEGPRVFAAPTRAMASVFMVPTDDSWTQSGNKDGTPFIVISDRERFESLDTGGAIYSLPNDSFETDLEKGLRENEYSSEEVVEPIEIEEYESGLQAMIELGVNVYFVDKETFKKLAEAGEQGGEILDTLIPEKK